MIRPVAVKDNLLLNVLSFSTPIPRIFRGDDMESKDCGIFWRGHSLETGPEVRQYYIYT